MSETSITRFLVPASATLRQAARCINGNGQGVALVVADDDRLEMTVTDGDIRRAMLDGIHLDEPLVILRRRNEQGARPVTAPIGTDAEAATRIMRGNGIRQLPLVDEHGRVHDLLTLEAAAARPQLRPMEAVIMAGGLGSRLSPLTESRPKTMLPVGDRPLIEHIVDQLREAGIHRVNVSTHHLREQIQEHLGDGSDFGVELTYVTEDEPLGTAGAVGLLSRPEEPLLIINGDVLSRVDLRAMRAFHDEHRASLTVGVCQYDLQVPYGVLDCAGARVRAIREKPVQFFFINSGIYLLEPGVHDFIPRGRPSNMTDLIGRLIEAGRPVVSFPIVEYWLDVGRHEDYERAQTDFAGASPMTTRTHPPRWNVHEK